MLKHRRSKPVHPRRVVLLGAAGFVGATLAENLQKRDIEVCCLTRKEIDLLSDNASQQLSKVLSPTDVLVVIAAQAPVKNNVMLIDNLRMMAAVCAALAEVRVVHVLYVSSDAVYADRDGPLTENSCAQPSSLHGVMHLARETMLAEVCGTSLCILRPTLIYGSTDPHNGYGPNRFRRLANQGSEISLFGAGEERRDHVYIADVAELTARCVLHGSVGILNIATGTVTSFRDIAEQVVALAHRKVPITQLPRTGPMPHRGYRPFDNTATFEAFPDFIYTPLDRGLALSQQQEFPDGRN